MVHSNKIDSMLARISGKIDQLENELKEEYKKLIRVSAEFDGITSQYISLQRKTLPESDKDFETTCFVEQLCMQISTTFGSERDTNLIFEAAMAVMDECSTAVVTSRN